MENQKYQEQLANKERVLVAPTNESPTDYAIPTIKDVVGISSLFIRAEDGSTNPILYGNGLNQIGIHFILDAVDKNNQSIYLYDFELSDLEIIPINFDTGQTIDTLGWHYTNLPSEWHTVSNPNYANQRDVGFSYKTLYISCD